MNTIASMQAPARTINLRETLRGYWRRRVIFFVVAGIFAALTVALALLLPPTYMAGATILIEQQEIPQELVRSAVTSFADQRVQVISQRVMTTQNLLGLIERYNLYPEMRLTKPREVLLLKMRQDIALKMISADVIDPRSGRPTQATIAFNVSYKNHSPELALKVANDLTSLYLNENLTSRTQMAEQTSSFFSAEAARLQTRILELDKELSDFKQKNHDKLPDISQLNIQISERTELELRDAENRIGAMDSQRVLLEAQLVQINPTMQVFSDTGLRVMSAEDRLKALKSQLAGLKARYAPDHPDIINTEREVAGLEKEVKGDDGTSDVARQLDEAKAQLARAKEKYAPDHPDVVRLTRVVEELEKSVASAPTAAEGARAKERLHADNPAYIQVKGQLDSLSVERVSALKKRDELQAKLDEYERRLAQAPAVERQFRALARDLDTAQLKYQEMRSKQSEVQVSQNLETEHKGERFTMIEPPLPPEKPISPNRFLILAMGFVLSLGAGAGAAILRNNLDVSVRGVQDMRALLSVPPLAAIPVIITQAESKKHRRIMRYSWLSGFVSVTSMVIFVHVFVRPLDVVWISLLHRFGM
ncbi:MAG TPA: Wzz/FepE/Etk N-terminal domain-containing protein [Steroidobacteraceae bacterium]